MRGKTNALIGGGGGSDFKTEVREITPTAFPTIVSPNAGVDAMTKVTVNAPDNLTSANIIDGVTIAGVTGTANIGDAESISNLIEPVGTYYSPEFNKVADSIDDVTTDDEDAFIGRSTLPNVYVYDVGSGYIAKQSMNITFGYKYTYMFKGTVPASECTFSWNIINSGEFGNIHVVADIEYMPFISTAISSYGFTSNTNHPHEFFSKHIDTIIEGDIGSTKKLSITVSFEDTVTGYTRSSSSTPSLVGGCMARIVNLVLESAD